MKCKQKGDGVELSVVVPTYNERANVPEVIARLEIALERIRWEVIFVDDDSPDGTAELVREYALEDKRIRLVHRVGRRGLASACSEGAMASSACAIAVMDADLQHDEALLPRMFAKLCGEGLDVVVGTRNADGGSMAEFSTKRQMLSRLGQRVSRAVCRCELSDTMSGFFVVDREFFLEVVRDLHPGGFKILLDMLASSRRPVKVGEIGYRFRTRQRGESKLDGNTAIEYLILLLNKMLGGVIPIRFVMFSLVGASGIIAHLICLSLLMSRFHWSFVAAQVTASFVAMTENFFLNNAITYRDRKLRGMYRVSGLASFWVACSFGAWANVIFAHSLLIAGARWYFAGLAGVVLSSVWNYSISNLFTWQVSPERARRVGEIEALPENMEVSN